LVCWYSESFVASNLWEKIRLGEKYVLLMIAIFGILHEYQNHIHVSTPTKRWSSGPTFATHHVRGAIICQNKLWKSLTWAQNGLKRTAHQVAAGGNFIWPTPPPGALRGASMLWVCVCVWEPRPAALTDAGTKGWWYFPDFYCLFFTSAPPNQTLLRWQHLLRQKLLSNENYSQRENTSSRSGARVWRSVRGQIDSLLGGIVWKLHSQLHQLETNCDGVPSCRRMKTWKFGEMSNLYNLTFYLTAISVYRI